MSGRLGDAASIIGEGEGERLPLFLTFPYTQIARHAGYRFQSLYHLGGQKRIRAGLTFTLEPQGRQASTPAWTRIRPPASRRVPKSERIPRIILSENSANVRSSLYVVRYTEVQSSSNAVQVGLSSHIEWVYPGLRERWRKPAQTVLESVFLNRRAEAGTGPWHPLYRATRGSPGSCHLNFLSIFHELIFYSGIILSRIIFVNVSKS